MDLQALARRVLEPTEPAITVTFPARYLLVNIVEAFDHISLGDVIEEGHDAVVGEDLHDPLELLRRLSFLEFVPGVAAHGHQLLTDAKMCCKYLRFRTCRLP